MGKFTSCVFHMANERHCYWPGEKIEGKVSIELSKDIRVSGVFIFLFGGCHISWQSGGADIGCETYLDRHISIFGNRPKEAGGRYSLTAGQHVFEFSFLIPTSGLQSSFEGRYGCIRYWLRLNFALPFPKLDKTWTYYISVVSRIPVHTPQGLLPATARNERLVSNAFGIGDIGKVTLDAATNKSAFCPGETILVDLLAQNETNKDVGVVSVTLVQRVTYSTGGLKRVMYISRILRTIRSMKLLAGQVIRWEGEPLEIDLVPPSSPPNGSSLLNVKYHVDVVVEGPQRFYLDIRLPITIGTVTPSGLRFVKCSRGFSKFQYGNSNYEVTDYVPSTVCVGVSEGGTEIAHAARCPSVEGSPEEYPLGDQTTKLLRPLGPPERVALDNDQASCSHHMNGAAGLPKNLKEGEPQSYVEVVGGAEFAEKSDHKGAILLIRFPLRDLKPVKSLLMRHRDSLKPLDGHMINFSPSPFLRYSHFPWPPLTSAAVFYFGTQEKSEQWLDQLVTAEPLLTSTWSAIIAENSTRIPTPNFQHQTLQITITMSKKMVKSEQQPQSGQEKFYRSSREDLGSLVAYSLKPKFLLGHWSEQNNLYQPDYKGQYQNQTEHLPGKLHYKSSTNERSEQAEKKSGKFTFPERVELAASGTCNVFESVLSGEIRGIQSVSINSEYINCEEDTGVMPAKDHPTACKEHTAMMPALDHPTACKEDTAMMPALDHLTACKEDTAMMPALDHPTACKEDTFMMLALDHPTACKEDTCMMPALDHPTACKEDTVMMPALDHLTACKEDTGMMPALDHTTACNVPVHQIEDGTSDSNFVPREDKTETVVSVVCYQYPDMTKYLDLAAKVFDQELPKTLEKAELLGMSVTSVILPGRSLW